MHAKITAKSMPCIPGALPGGLTRTSFFNGMFLTQADLENEQRYWRIKRRLTNRALGTGVVWGLRASWDESARRFHLGPGYALDCCGNDLVVDAAQEMTERALIDTMATELRTGFAARAVPRADHMHGNVLVASPGKAPVKACVVLQYVECPDELRPVHRDACTTDIDRCETARVRETTRLLLVAPPAEPAATPIEQFAEELEALYDSFGDSELRDRLFPGWVPAAEESSTGLVKSPPVTLHIRLADAGPDDERTVRPFTTGPSTYAAPAIAVLADDQDPAQPVTVTVQFELRPDPGWVLAGGQVSNQDSGRSVPNIAAVNPPLDLTLMWREQLEVEIEGEDPQDAATERTFHVTGLRLSPLFRDAPTIVTDFDISFTLLVRPMMVDGRLTHEVVLVDRGETPAFGVELTVLSTTTEEFSGGADCFAALAGGPFALLDGRDPGAAPKTLLLGGLYAWLASQLHGDTTSTTWTGKRLLAVWSYIAAWRLLFGVNPVGAEVDEERSRLAGLLDQLLERWCTGFVYPGPRCTDNHHGVYLGCVELTRSGTIASFDPWEHRRHVLTGPLLSHWGGQLGLAPLDVVAGRFFRAICCAAGVDTPTLPELPAWSLPTVIDSSVTLESFGNAGGLVTNGAYVILGDDDEALDRLRGIGIELLPAEEISWPVLIGRFVDALGGNRHDEDDGKAGILAVYRLRQTGSHRFTVLLPASGEEVDDRRERFHRLQNSMHGSNPAPAIARDAVRQFAAELIAGIPIERLVIMQEDDAATITVVETLRDEELTAIGQLIELGAERLDTQVLGGSSSAVVEALFEAIDVLSGNLTRLAGEAASALSPTFRRSSLTDGTFLGDLKTRLAALTYPGSSDLVFAAELDDDVLLAAAARAARMSPRG